MKWVKVSIGAVIAIISVGIIATSVYKMTGETTTEKVVTFEILTDDTNSITSGTYDLIDSVILLDEQDVVINFKSLKVNNTVKNDVYINILYGYINIFDNDIGGSIEIYNNDSYSDEGFSVTIGDTFEITFEVPQPPVISGATATLLSLIPILFIGGIVYFTLSKREF